MLRPPKRVRLTVETDLRAQSEIEGLEVARVLIPGEEEETSSSCSFNFSYPSTSSSPLPSFPAIPVSQEEEKEAEEVEAEAEEVEAEAEEVEEEAEEVEEEAEEVEEEAEEVEAEAEEVEAEAEEVEEEAEEAEAEEVEEEVEVEAEEAEAEEEEPATTLSPPQSPQSSSSSSTSWNASEGSNSQDKEDTSSLQTSGDTESLPKDPVDEKVADLVRFMILKYRMKEPITEAEMLMVIAKPYRKHFPVIFKKASKSLEVISGIDLKEVDPTVHSYVLVNSLDFISNEVSSDDNSMPKNGLLVIILGVIFIEGDCAPEEDMWDFLNILGVYAGREHFLYGEPRKLITVDWVREDYLEYRQVPGSDPPRYEFLWGPRARAETTKVKVLEFLSKIKGIDPISFALWHEVALQDEERAQAGIGSEESTADASVAQHRSAAPPAPAEE